MKVDGEEIDYSGLPERYRLTVEIYLEHGCRPGNAWTAIMEHDLMAVLYADDETLQDMPKILRWLHNHAPVMAHGSAEKVQAWIRERRTAA